MNLEQTTDLYASVLRQLLPVGGYDTSPHTEALSVDVYAHAKLFAQADLDAKRILSVLEAIPQELINEYELEYGLPLKCAVNTSRTIEERLQVLKWVRTSQNVFNRAYLEQILAIFGVVLIDVMKFKPLLCTAACDSPANTEQLRYKVFLRLQYPVNADMSCIIENYLPGYLRIEWVIDMPWGDWILNSGVAVNTNGVAHYTAYKTNQREYYDSYANLDLTAAIVRSLHDTDMQQWQAVKDAGNQLTGVNDWVLNPANNQIQYYPPNSDPSDPDYQWIYNRVRYNSATTVCREFWSQFAPAWAFHSVSNSEREYPVCVGFNAEEKRYDSYQPTQRVARTEPIEEQEEKTLPLDVVAAQVILNAESSDQGIFLLAQVYIEEVAKSIFNADESKQFVKPTNLRSQFDQNKTLRT